MDVILRRTEDEKVLATIELEDLVSKPDLHGNLEESGLIDEAIDEETEELLEVSVVIKNVALNQEQVFHLVDRLYDEDIETSELVKMLNRNDFNLLDFIGK